MPEPSEVRTIELHPAWFFAAGAFLLAFLVGAFALGSVAGQRRSDAELREFLSDSGVRGFAGLPPASGCSCSIEVICQSGDAGFRVGGWP